MSTFHVLCDDRRDDQKTEVLKMNPTLTVNELICTVRESHYSDRERCGTLA
jgi:hypothetical protein